MDHEIVGDEVEKTTDAVSEDSCTRKRHLRRPNGCGNPTKRTMRVNSGMHFSSYVGAPYQKLKKWFSQRRNKGRHCVGQGSSDAQKPEGDIETTQSELHVAVRKFPGLPLLPVLPTTTQQTTQTVRQTTLNWKMQTITHQTNTKPLCWPPAYQANLFSHASLLPSLSRILVDHLKENPHLLTPVQPTKRRRVEEGVNECNAVVLDKVKTWLMTQTTDNVNDCDNDDPTRDNNFNDITTIGTSEDKGTHSRKRPASDALDLSCPKRPESSNNSVPDDVSVMFQSYQNVSPEYSNSEMSNGNYDSMAEKQGNVKDIVSTYESCSTNISNSARPQGTYRKHKHMFLQA